MQLTRNVPKS